MKNWFTLSLSLTVLLSVVSTNPAYASASGQAGRTARTAGGCSGGGCHASAASTATSVRILQAVNGRVTVAPGETIQLTAVVAHESRSRAGINVAVKTTETGTVNAGTIIVVPGAGTRLLGGELTHLNSKIMQGGEARFEFTWRAPAEEGVYFLRAIGNAVNGDGSAGAADQWNWMDEVVQVVVSPTASVNEVQITSVLTRPVPAHSEVHVTASTTPGEPLTVDVTDATGNVVHRENVFAWADDYTYVWRGANSSGQPAPQGVYIISVRGNNRITRGTAVLVR